MNKTIAAVLVLLSAPAAAAAGVYPGREIELVNAYPATGPAEIAGTTPANKVLRAMQNHAVPPVTDVLAHSLRQTLSFALDTSVALERRSRRGGMEGQQYVAGATPDGHTLLLAGSTFIVIRPQMLRDVRFDPRRELAPVALVARMPMVLIAARGSSVTRFLEQARAAPGRLHLGSSGEFTTAHLAATLFTSVTGTALEHVSFNGGAAAARGVVADQIEAAFVPLPAVLPYAANPRLRPLAVADHERHPTLKHVPTVSEAGVPGAEISSWYGLFAPAITPRSVIRRISSAIATDLKSLQTQRLISNQGLNAMHLSAEEFAELINADYRRWAPLIGQISAR